MRHSLESQHRFALYRASGPHWFWSRLYRLADVWDDPRALWLDYAPPRRA
jgi:hypothetical protein